MKVALVRSLVLAGTAAAGALPMVPALPAAAQGTPPSTVAMLDQTEAEVIIDACLAEEELAETLYRDCVTRVAVACDEVPENRGLESWQPCVAAELALWDGRVTRTYDEIIRMTRERGEPGTVKPEERALVASQTAWLAYRGSDCTLEEVVWLGGADGSHAALGCRMRLTGERAIDLSLIARAVASP